MSPPKHASTAGAKWMTFALAQAGRTRNLQVVDLATGPSCFGPFILVGFTEEECCLLKMLLKNASASSTKKNAKSKTWDFIVKTIEQPWAMKVTRPRNLGETQFNQ